MAENIPQANSSNKGLWITGIVIAVLVVGLITNGFGLFSPKDITGNVVDNIELSISSSPVLGESNAPVTIYIFSDFSCPYCSAAAGFNPSVQTQLKSQDSTWQAPMPAIIDKYVKTGKVKLVFKYAPGHGSGVPAHLVGYALNEQGLFWQFHDKVFENQADAGDYDKMKAIAKDLGANMTQLQEFLDSNKGNFLMQQEIEMANSNNVEGTPTFFINNREVSGAQSFSAFQKVIDEELAKAN